MRIALGIEYFGANYFGWQRQREVNSIQQELETALSRVANHPVEIQCAGRTDAGVNANTQCICFWVGNTLAGYNLIAGLNNRFSWNADMLLQWQRDALRLP